MKQYFSSVRIACCLGTQGLHFAPQTSLSFINVFSQGTFVFVFIFITGIPEPPVLSYLCVQFFGTHRCCALSAIPPDRQSVK